MVKKKLLAPADIAEWLLTSIITARIWTATSSFCHAPAALKKIKDVAAASVRQLHTLDPFIKGKIDLSLFGSGTITRLQKGKDSEHSFLGRFCDNSEAGFYPFF